MNAKNDKSEDVAPEDATKATEAESEAKPEVVVADSPAKATKAAKPAKAAKSEATEAQTTKAEASSPPGDSGEAQAPTTETVSPPVQTVYVTAPTPPKRKGNRGMGAFLTVVATVVFAAVYAGVSALLILFVDSSAVPDAVSKFLVGPFFYTPVAAFLVLMILWALLVNRASWWAWVIGSLLIAAATYFATIGVLLLMSGGFGLTGSQAALAFVGFAVNPALIAAALLARETSLWFGAAIARRGRRVRERNYEAWMAFETEEAQKKSELGGAAAV